MIGLNDKPTAWFFGCSMTYGHNCHSGDLYYEKYKKEGDEIWTKLVADHLGYNEKNLGVQGIGNIEILRMILDNKDNIKSDDAVIVGATDGTRVQTFIIEEKVVPISLNHWMIDSYPWHLKGLDQDFVDSLKQYMVNCRLRYINDHIKFDMKLIEDVIALIKPKYYVGWLPDLWNNFEFISKHTNNEIYDFHWSFNGHRQMAEWIISNNFKNI